MLRFMPNKTAFELEKLMKSVAANAENNYDLDPEISWIKEIYADEGPTMRRFRAEGAWPCGPHQQAHLQHHGRRRGSGRPVNGTQSQSDRLPARHRHRLGIEVVRGAQLHRAAPRGHEDPRLIMKELTRAGISQDRARAFGQQGRCHAAHLQARHRDRQAGRERRADPPACWRRKSTRRFTSGSKRSRCRRSTPRLIAESIAEQIARRVAYRRAMKHAVQQAMRRGAKGVKIRLRGRLGGAEMSRIGHRDGRPGAAAHAARRHRLTASSMRTRPTDASASRSGSTRATSCRRVAEVTEASLTAELADSAAD